MSRNHSKCSGRSKGSLGSRKQAAAGGEGVDVGFGFVAAQADDSRKTEGESRIVARAFADGIEGDFENDARFDLEPVAFFGNHQTEEFVGEFGDFVVGEAGVGFAERGELVGGFVAQGEGVVAQDASPFAVAVFDGGYHDIESGEAFFEFHPTPTASAGGVEALRVFDHQAFVAALAGGVEEVVELSGSEGFEQLGAAEGFGEIE